MVYIVLANANKYIATNHVENVFNDIDDFIYCYSEFIKFEGKQKETSVMFDNIYDSVSEFKEEILHRMDENYEIILYFTNDYKYTLHREEIYHKPVDNLKKF